MHVGAADDNTVAVLKAARLDCARPRARFLCNRSGCVRERRPRRVGGSSVVVVGRSVRRVRPRSPGRGRASPRTSGMVRSEVRRDGLVVKQGSSSVEVTSAAHVGGAWTRHRSGASRETRFGSQAIVFADDMTEEFLTVERRFGPKTWRWRIDAGRWTPRLRGDGGVSFGADHVLAPFAIEPAKIFDEEGADVTPTGTSWSLRQMKSKWWLELRLDDSSLPLPYVIDPAVSFRQSSTSSTGRTGRPVSRWACRRQLPPATSWSSRSRPAAVRR